MYHTILRYDTIHTIHTLYRTIHEHLRYTDTIQNFLHTIRYVSYNTDNYADGHLYAYDGPTTFMHLCKKKKPYISKEHKQFDPTCYEFLNRL